MKNPRHLRLACIAMAAVMALSAAPAMTYADITSSSSESQVRSQADEDENAETSSASNEEQAERDEEANETSSDSDENEEEETNASSKSTESDTSSVSQAESYAKSEAEDEETKDSSNDEEKDDKGWESAVVVEGDEDTDNAKVIDATETDSDEVVKKLTETNPTSAYKKDEASGSNPLNLKKNQETIAVVQNELLLFQNLGGQNNAVVFDNYLNQSSPVADSEYKGGLNFEKTIGSGNHSYAYNFEKAWNYNSGDYATQNNDINQYSAVKAIACDPFGTGRDSCVAYVGLKCTGASHADVMTWLYDYKNGKCSEVINLATLYWNEIADKLTIAEMENFMAITAGNYYGNINDNEGYGFATDSVVVYAPSAGLDKKANGLVELQWTQDPNTHEITLKSKSDFNTSLLHQGYGYGDYTWAYDGNPEDKLACDLATGDFNSDGIEDLAVLSYVGDVVSKTYGDGTLYIPYLAVSMGSTDKKILENKTSSQYFEQYSRQENGVYLWDTARSPGISVGDADGDGVEEIAVAGIKVTQSTSGKEPNSGLYKSDLWYNGKQQDSMVVGIYKVYEGNLQVASLSINVQTNEWKRTGVHVGDAILERSGVAFVALNGQHNQEHLFIDGSIYEFQSGTCIINNNPIKTAEYFNHADNGAGGSSITNTYIQSVTVGNFDNNYAGREQVIFVIGLKASKANKDALAVLSLGGIYDNDKTTDGEIKTQNFQNFTGIYDNAYYERECYLNHCESSNIKDKFSCVVVALDMDDDGLKVKYSNMEYVESDAEVQAVIQAAPTFGGLKQYEGTDATSYKVVGSYTYETNSSYTGKIDFGGIIGISADSPIVKWDLRVKIGGGYSFVNGKSQSETQTYTASFTATNQR